MNKTTVYKISSLGTALLDKPQGRITGDARLLTGLIDGSSNVAEIAEKVPPSVRVHLVEIFTRLLTYGVIEEKDGTESSTAELKKPRQGAKAKTKQNMQIDKTGNEEGLALNAEDAGKSRIELEKELFEVRSKLEATIARQKKVEEDYLRLTQQVSAYTQVEQAKSAEKMPEPLPQENTGTTLHGSLDSISQLNQALLEQQEILNNTLRLRAYQAQLNEGRRHWEYEVEDTKIAQTHPQYKSLRGLEFFKGFSNSELLNFLKVAKWQEFEAEDTILSEGDIGMSFYVIISGSVNIFRKDEMLTSLSRGDFFGEFAYLSGEDPVRSAHAVAATSCELLAVDPLDIEFSTVQLRLRVVEALLRGQVRRTLLSDQRIDKFSDHLKKPPQ